MQSLVSERIKATWRRKQSGEVMGVQEVMSPGGGKGPEDKNQQMTKNTQMTKAQVMFSSWFPVSAPLPSPQFGCV